MSIITHWGQSYGSYTYDAWGNVLSVSGDIANLNPIRYRGYYYDTETRLYYLGSRYYDPQVKRFVNADGYASTGQGFIGQNMFVYCNNSPITMEDSTGKVPRNCLAVSDGAAGACASNYRPAPKAYKVLQGNKALVSNKFGVAIPSYANISLSVGTYIKTQDELADTRQKKFLSDQAISHAITTCVPYGKEILLFLEFFKTLENDDTIHDPGIYDSYRLVIEYDFADPLTNTNVHYTGSYLYVKIYNQAGIPSYKLLEKNLISF